MQITNYPTAVAAALSGDNAGFTWLYEQTYRDKYYIAIKYMKNEDEAADVLQDAYIRAWEKLDTLDNAFKFPAWLGQIVANTAINAINKKRPMNFSQLEGESDEGDVWEYEAIDERVENQPELAYTDAERSAILKEMVDSLSDEQRMCVMMHYIEEIPIRDIAAQMGCSEGTIKSRLNYARKNLKASADALEKKGYKFFELAPMALLLLLMKKEVQAQGLTVFTKTVPKSAPTPKVSHAPSSGVEPTAKVNVKVDGSRPAGGAGEISGGSGQAAGGAGKATQMAGRVAGGIAKPSFFGTAGGKALVAALVVAIGVGGGFAAHKIMQSRNAVEQVAEVSEIPDEPEVTATPAPTATEEDEEESRENEATEEPKTEAEKEKEEETRWKTAYADVVRERGKEHSYNLIYLDDDDIPELYVQKSYVEQENLFVNYLFYTFRENKVVEVMNREDSDHPVSGRYAGQETVRYIEKAGTLIFDDGFVYMQGWLSESFVYQMNETGTAPLQYTVSSTDGFEGRHDTRVSPDGSRQEISEKEAEELSFRNAETLLVGDARFGNPYYGSVDTDLMSDSTAYEDMKTYEQILQILEGGGKTETASSFEKSKFEKDLLGAKQFYLDWYVTHGDISFVDKKDEITGIGAAEPYGAAWPYYAVKSEIQSIEGFRKEAHHYYSYTAIEEMEKKQKELGYDPLFAEKDGKLYLPKADGLGGFFEAEEAEVTVTKESDEKYKVVIVMNAAIMERSEEFTVDYLLEDGEWCFGKAIDTYIGQTTSIHYTYADI